MEDVRLLVEKSNKSLRTADHLAYVTYPLLKETKLLISIAENLFNSLKYGMEALLKYERMYKRVPIYADIYDHKIEIFKTRVIQRYNLDREYIQLIEDLRKIVEYRKNSPVEFTRRDKFVMCSETYKTKTIDYVKIKEYLNKAKPFIDKVSKVLRENDRRLDSAKGQVLRADHLFHVTLKYTRTADVIKNTINRLVNSMDFVLVILLKKKKVKPIPEIGLLKAETLFKKFPKDEMIQEIVEYYKYLKTLDKGTYSKHDEYRKGVAIVVNGEDINIARLRELLDQTKGYVKWAEELKK